MTVPRSFYSVCYEQYYFCDSCMLLASFLVKESAPHLIMFKDNCQSECQDKSDVSAEEVIRRNIFKSSVNINQLLFKSLRILLTQCTVQGYEWNPKGHQRELYATMNTGHPQ